MRRDHSPPGCGRVPFREAASNIGIRNAVEAVPSDAFRAQPARQGHAPRYLGLLMIIGANPGSNQSSLAEAVGLRRSSLVAILDQLERDGIVRRDPAPDDRRSKAVRLTGHGSRVLKELTEEAEAHEAALTRGIPEADLAILRAALDRIILNMRALDMPAATAAADRTDSLLATIGRGIGIVILALFAILLTRRLTRPQRRALATLDPVILRQFADLQAQGVAWATLVSLMRDAPGRPALARQVDLKPATWLKVPYISFFRLTDAGIARQNL